MLRDEQAAHRIQRLRERDTQRLRARGEFHARPDANQQRIADQTAQAGQRMTHRGLRQADLAGRAAHMSFGDERIERDQQVEVEGG